MPVRLIFTIILMVLVACFTGFNLTNKCDVWLFNTFKDVPVVVTILISFIAGVVVALFSSLIARTRNAESKSDSLKKAGRKGKEKNISTQIPTSSDPDYKG